MTHIDRIYDGIRREERAARQRRIDDACRRAPGLAEVFSGRQAVFADVAGRRLSPAEAQARLVALAAEERALLEAAALLTAHPPLRDPETAGALVGMMEMGILPLLLSFGLAAACRPLLVRRGGLCAALLLLAFVLMTLSMGALWYAGLLNFHRGELQEGFMRHTALLYWDQPLLYFTLLELFAPLSASYLKSARYLRNNRAGRPARG